MATSSSSSPRPPSSLPSPPPLPPGLFSSSRGPGSPPAASSDWDTTNKLFMTVTERISFSIQSVLSGVWAHRSVDLTTELYWRLTLIWHTCDAFKLSSVIQNCFCFLLSPEENPQTRSEPHQHGDSKKKKSHVGLMKSRSATWTGTKPEPLNKNKLDFPPWQTRSDLVCVKNLDHYG